MSADTLNNLLEAGQVKRYHTVSLPGQTLAEHSWGVAVCYDYLTQGNPERTSDGAPLYHDLGEVVTGDLPATFKSPSRADIVELLNEGEKNWLKEQSLDCDWGNPVLKLSDIMEGMWFCARQHKLGNGYALQIYKNYHKRLYDFMDGKDWPKVILVRISNFEIKLIEEYIRVQTT